MNSIVERMGESVSFENPTGVAARIYVDDDTILEGMDHEIEQGQSAALHESVAQFHDLPNNLQSGIVEIGSAQPEPERGTKAEGIQLMLDTMVRDFSMVGVIRAKSEFRRRIKEYGDALYVAGMGDGARDLSDSLPPSPLPVREQSGISLIAAERERQIAVEGWTPEHDDKHNKAELNEAARAYARAAELQVRSGCEPTHAGLWPWDASWWKPSPEPIRNLVKAGALIAAEIDRLQRTAIAGEKEE